MSVDIALIVNGRRYYGFESGRVTRTMEGLAGSFALEVSDRWGGQEDPLPIVEEDACRIEIGEVGQPGTVVIDGFVDRVRISADATNRRLSISGKDRAAALVECSATAQGASIKSGAAAGGGEIDPTRHSAESTKWIYTHVDVVEFARALAKPFGVPVAVQPGLASLPKASVLIVHPGESAFEALKRAAEAAGVIVMSDGVGGILITRAGTSRAASLIEGFNIVAGEVDRDATNRFHRYLITTQIPGTDEASGDATQVQAQAVDEDVRRTERTILIRPDKGYNTADARRRADWEARIRAARAVSPTITVQGWLQPNGTLWPLNALTSVQAPRMLRLDGEMLISEVEYSIGAGGQMTQIHVVRPDAFTPEPQATVSGAGGWDELAKGV